MAVPEGCVVYLLPVSVDVTPFRKGGILILVRSVDSQVYHSERLVRAGQ